MCKKNNIVNKNSILWVFKLVGLGIFIFLVASLDKDKLWQILNNIDLAYLIFASLLTISALTFTKVLRWYFILKWMKIDYPLHQAYFTYLASIFIGLLTPGRLGEMVRSIYLRNDKQVEIHEGIATIGTDRIFDLIGMLSLVIPTILLNDVFSDLRILGWIGLGLLVFTFLFIIFFRFLDKKKIASLRIFGSTFLGRLLASFSKQIELLTPKRFLFMLLLTAFPTTIFAFQCTLLAKAMNVDLNMLIAGGIAASVNLVVLIPVTIYGLGTREATVISMFGFLSIGQAEAFSYSMLLFLNFWIVGGVWGLFFWLIKPLKVSEAKKIKIQSFNSSGKE